VKDNPRVLVVDPEAGIQRLLMLELSAQEFSVKTASSAKEAIALMEGFSPDIITTEMAMPGMSGLDFMLEVRHTRNIPFILIVEEGKDSDIARGLDKGADDYILKPFSPEEVGARIKAILRRNYFEEVMQIVKFGNLEIDLTRRLVRKSGETVTMSRTEWQLIEYLARNQGKIIPNAQLLNNVFGPEYINDVPYLRVWISRIRSKVEPNSIEPVIIKTVPGIGYILETTPTDQTGV
jgi:two-component system, OmpR family, KDP operon response regulator KdpE